MGYSGQTSVLSAAGRWCCQGSRPSEITTRLNAVAVGGPWFSYQDVTGSWGPGLFYSPEIGYFKKRYKRTLRLNIADLNIDYVLEARVIPWANSLSRLCGYAYGDFNCPRIFPGFEPGNTFDGITYQTFYEPEPFPSYTITFQSCNSNLPGNPQTTGTVRREYEFRPYVYAGNYSYVPNGDWARDSSFDTETEQLPCYYQWSFTARTVLDEPSCDLRPRGLSWSGSVTVSPDVDMQSYGIENVRQSYGSNTIDNNPMLPQFSLTVNVLPE
jgi:hypothetical protein